MSFIPKIHSRDMGEGWTLYFYDIFNSIFTDGAASLQQMLSPYLKKEQTFQLLKSIGGVHFLLLIRGKDKTILTATPYLNWEMTLLNWGEGVVYSGIDSEADRRGLKSLKKHIEEFLKQDIHRLQLPIEEVEIENDLKRLSQYIVDPEFNHYRKQLYKKVKNYKMNFFERSTDLALGLTAEYDLLRIHLLKFLAILPSLDHDKEGTEVKSVLMETFRRLLADSKTLSEKSVGRPLPWYLLVLFTILSSLTHLIPAFLLASNIRKLVKFMARRFIAGIDIHDASSSLSNILSTGRSFTLDQLGELVVSEKEDKYYESQMKNESPVGQTL